MHQHLSWRGERCLYDGFSIMWRGQISGGASDLGAVQWRSSAGVRDVPLPGRIVWVKPPHTSGRPLHELVPADFALRLGSAGIHAAASGSDVGAALELLPILPKSTPGAR
jgi:hypothetical protein